MIPMPCAASGNAPSRGKTGATAWAPKRSRCSDSSAEWLRARSGPRDGPPDGPDREERLRTIILRTSSELDDLIKK